jgi:hypothetical protein
MARSVPALGGLGSDDVSSLLGLKQAGPMPAGLVAVTLPARGSSVMARPHTWRQ